MNFRLRPRWENSSKVCPPAGNGEKSGRGTAIESFQTSDAKEFATVTPRQERLQEPETARWHRLRACREFPDHGTGTASPGRAWGSSRVEERDLRV